jgi:hypothetical protein
MVAGEKSHAQRGQSVWRHVSTFCPFIREIRVIRGGNASFRLGQARSAWHGKSRGPAHGMFRRKAAVLRPPMALHLAAPGRASLTPKALDSPAQGRVLAHPGKAVPCRPIYPARGCTGSAGRLVQPVLGRQVTFQKAWDEAALAEISQIFFNWTPAECRPERLSKTPPREAITLPHWPPFWG